MYKWILSLLLTVVLVGCSAQATPAKSSKPKQEDVAVTQVSADTVKLEFPSAKYPETAQHIKEAIAAGKSPVCTIDRDGADHNRDLSLKGVPTKKGKDRDEWPMAMCSEVRGCRY